MQIIKRFFKWVFIFLISVFCILSVIPYFFNSKLKDVATKPPYTNSHFFYYNHTKFHFRLFVPKQIKHKVLLIHGFSASTFCFRKNIDSLINTNALVVAMDMPAFGYSDKSESANYTDSNKIAAIHFLLNHVDKSTTHQKWNLIGHSMGGTVIGKFASTFPQQTQSLIFIDGVPMPQNHSFIQSLALYPPLLKWADIILERYFLNQKTFEELLSSAYSSQADTMSVNGYMKPFEIKGSGSAIFRMAGNSGYSQVNDSIINSLPKLVIWGKKDQWIPIKYAKDFLHQSQITSLIINDAGHCAMETHSREVNDAITNFISNLE